LGAKLIDVAAGLVFRRGQLLITQRNPDSHLGGFWEFPGGKREPGETYEQCLVRELREELGIEVSVGSLIESITHAYPEKTVRLNFYRCSLGLDEPKPLGCADLRWVRRDQLGEFQFPPADEQLLERLKADWLVLAAESGCQDCR
jgi:8-oxo-dGTP diphosphatase